ncbi:MAG TPA: hypothetical protein VFO61_02580 [Alphaproteobacteria bacterium]|nr:hypothetical protein [Alphaproteobacteria bacterium]
MIPLAVVGRTFYARLMSYQTAFVSADRFTPDDRFVLFKVGGGTLGKTPEIADAIRSFAAAHNGATIYDTCDPAHHDPVRTVADLQRDLLKQASLVTCASVDLLAELGPLAAGPVRLIEDTVDCPVAPPKFAPGDPVRIVWFGWMSDHRFSNLSNHLARIQATCPDRRFECTVLSQELPGAWIPKLNAALTQKGRGAVRVSHRRWNLPEAWDVLADHDIALIPYDLSPTAPPASIAHNRLSTAIRRGVFVVASPVPAYRPLADCCWLGTDLAEGVAWALAHPEEARARIEAGQARVEALYGPEAVGARWIEVLKEFAAS